MPSLSSPQDVYMDHVRDLPVIRGGFFILSAMCVILVQAAPVYAIEGFTERPAGEAGVIEGRIAEDAEADRKKTGEEPRIALDKKPPSPDDREALTFAINKIHVDGVSLLKPDDLHPVLERYQNRDLTVGDLNQAAAEIEQAVQRWF